MKDHQSIPFPIRVERRKGPVIANGIPLDGEPNRWICIIEATVRSPGDRILGVRQRQSGVSDELSPAPFEFGLRAINPETALQDGPHRHRAWLPAPRNASSYCLQGIEIQALGRHEVIDNGTNVANRPRLRQIDNRALDCRDRQTSDDRSMPVEEIVGAMKLHWSEVVRGPGVSRHHSPSPRNSPNAVELGRSLVRNRGPINHRDHRSQPVHAVPRRDHPVGTATCARPTMASDPTVDHVPRKAEFGEEVGGHHPAMSGGKLQNLLVDVR